MKLTEKEKSLRDEIAKQLFIHNNEPLSAQESFDDAKEFIRVQRKVHEKDKVNDHEDWEGMPG